MNDIFQAFSEFWTQLNAELASRALPEAGFGHANDTFKMKLTAIEAADMIEREMIEETDAQELAQI